MILQTGNLLRYAIKEYAGKCVAEIRKYLSSRDLQEVRTMYTDIASPTLEYKTILSRIDECRLKMMDELQN